MNQKRVAGIRWAVVCAAIAGAATAAACKRPHTAPPPHVVYVIGGDNTLRAFAFDPQSGGLTPIDGDPVPVMAVGRVWIALHPKAHLGFARGLTEMKPFGVRDGGRPRPVDFPLEQFTAPADAVAFDPAGRYIYLSSSGVLSGVWVYALDDAGRKATLVRGSPFAVGQASVIVPDPDGRFLFVPKSGPDGIVTITQDSTSGALARATVEPVTAPGSVSAMAAHRSGDFLAAICRSYTTRTWLVVYGVGPATGSLTQAPGSPLPLGPRPSGIVFDPSGRFLYVIDYDLDRVSAFALDAQGGLHDVPGSPFETPDAPESIAAASAPPALLIGSASSPAIAAYAIENTGALRPLKTTHVPARVAALTLTSTGPVLAAQPLPESSAFADLAAGSPADVADVVARTGTSEELAAQLKHPDWRVRTGAAMALTQRKAKAAPAVAALVAALDDEHDQVRQWVLHALQGIGPPARSAVPRLIPLLGAPSVGEREAAARALGAIGPDAKEAAAPLLEVASRSDGVTRAAALNALGRVGADETALVPLLVQALEDARVDVRGEAERQLTAMGPRAAPAVPQLARLIDYGNADVRRTAAAVLSSIGPAAAPAISALYGATEDDDQRVRQAAVNAIARIRGRS